MEAEESKTADSDLGRKILVRFACSPIFISGPIFLSAGTLNYWEAWLYMINFLVGCGFLTVYLYKHDRALLERRMRAGPGAEKRPAQKIIMLAITVASVLLIVVGGLDHRFGWSHVPTFLILLGNLAIALSFVIFYHVCRTNSFASATIEIARDQKVISSGPYGFVRHPMYSGGALLMVGVPLALGTYWGLMIVVALMPFLIWRIVDEEKLLVTELDGYSDYREKVRFRLIPWLY